MCGPRRADGDGLRIFPAPVDGSVAFVAWPWVPHPSVTDDDGLVDGPVMWGALDCPSGLAWLRDPEPLEPSVLGRMRAGVHRRPAAGEPLIAAGWMISKNGRKRISGSAIWSRDGEVLARSLATWIALSPEQLRTFGVVGSTR